MSWLVLIFYKIYPRRDVFPTKFVNLTFYDNVIVQVHSFEFLDSLMKFHENFLMNVSYLFDTFYNSYLYYDHLKHYHIIQNEFKILIGQIQSRTPETNKF